MSTDRPWDPFAPVSAAGHAELDDDGESEPSSGSHGGPAVRDEQDAAELTESDDDGLEDMRKDDLVDLAKRLRLSTSGTKPELIERIRDRQAQA